MEFNIIRERLMEKFIVLEDHIKDFYLHVLVENSVHKSLTNHEMSIEEIKDEKALKLYKDTLRDVVKSIPVHIMNVANIVRELQSYSEIMELFLKNSPKNKNELTPKKLFEIVNAVKRIRNKVTHNVSGNISDEVYKKLALNEKHQWNPEWSIGDKINFVESTIDHISALLDLYSSKTYLYLSESIAVSVTDHKDEEEVIVAKEAAKKKRINLVSTKNWKK